MTDYEYQKAIKWIVAKDDPKDYNINSIHGYASVELVAYIFDKPQEQVAEDVYELRVKRIDEIAPIEPHHPDCQCNLCYYDGEYKAIFRASEY